jgi:23S rRNA pseudouridine1911/1915/1917 synthase
MIASRRASAPLTILLETPDLVAVAKPAGLTTIPGRDGSDSVLEALGRQLNLPTAGLADPRLRVVHRLDKDTSGVLLFAENAAAQRALCKQFLDSSVRKEYLALVIGRPQADEGRIDAPLANHPTDRLRMVVAKNGKPAVTDWKVEKRIGDLTLLRCFPRTGRTHQIRVHLQSAGFPLAIDPLYRPQRDRPRNGEEPRPPGIYLSDFKRDYRPTRGEIERPLIDRLTLHAHRIALYDPAGGDVKLECEPPKDFRATIKQLEKLAGGVRWRG